MFLKHFLSDANWLAIIVAGVVYFMIGAIWYMPAVFGKAWAAGHKLSMNPEDSKGSLPMMMTLTGLLTLIIAVLVGFLVSSFYSQTVVSGLKIGLLAGAFVSCSMAINYTYTSKSLKVFFIDAGYHIVGTMICGVIISIWH